VRRMQILKDIIVKIEGRTSKMRALFDAGSTFTVMGYSVLEERFGKVSAKPLPKPLEGALPNGQKIVIDGYVDAEFIIDEYLRSERIYLSKDIVKKVVPEEREIALPELIIGSPTMEVWGLELDLKSGEIVYRGSFII